MRDSARGEVHSKADLEKEDESDAPQRKSRE